MNAWTLHLKNGLQMAVPPTLTSLTTFVLLEQEAWFEPEMSLLPHLLPPGAQALDIGANHGVVAMEMARCVGPAGHVWAFEPTAVPRARLLESRRLNGFARSLTVVPAGLADADGEASFAVHDNSELNSRGGAGARRETVQLLALDGWMQRHAPDARIGFVKLDAEGDELRVLAGAKDFFARQSPVVMFEFLHGKAVNRELIAAWHALGYELFRWSAELELLRPFDAGAEELAFALNLLAVRPEQQRALAARGLLADAAALAAEPPLSEHFRADAALAEWCTQNALKGLSIAGVAAQGPIYERCLHATAAAHLDRSLSPAARFTLMLGVRSSLQAAADQGASLGPAAWALLVHAQYATGVQGASINLALQLLARWPLGLDVTVPFATPSRSDLVRPRSTLAGDWLRQMLAEHVELHSSHSSYFRPPDLPRVAHLLAHPDHSAEAERRCLLAHVRSDRVAPLEQLCRLPDAAHTQNPGIWAGVLASMRPLAA